MKQSVCRVRSNSDPNEHLKPKSPTLTKKSLLTSQENIEQAITEMTSTIESMSKEQSIMKKEEHQQNSSFFVTSTSTYENRKIQKSNQKHKGMETF